MSIIEKRFSALSLVFALILLFAFVATAQELEITVKISMPDAAQISGRVTRRNSNQSNKNWSFANSVAGIENLGARITELSLANKQNRPVLFKKLAEGEYLADDEATFFDYRVNLKPLPTGSARAHVSWLSSDVGVLMMGDLLPQFQVGDESYQARIKFDLPVGWEIISNEQSLGDDAFYVENIEKTVFLFGKNNRRQEIQIGKTTLNLAISGNWLFADAEAMKIAGEIFDEYHRLFGEAPAEKAQIFLLRFPKEVKFGRWEAETRGTNLIVVSADMPFKTQSVQRLHEQLRHELFHLWMPNNLALTGNYDWFYEGFTVYQALRTGVSMNQIRFEDFLDTLAQAYNLDNLQSRKRSLIESSRNRWNGENNQIYARGMLTAFLCDVALLSESKGKRSIQTIFREIYQKHRVPSQSVEGNTAILNVLSRYSELSPTIEKYINGTQKIHWETDLERIGIEMKEETPPVRLGVKVKLSGRQKDLLDKLGYNNWRKISGKIK